MEPPRRTADRLREAAIVICQAGGDSQLVGEFVDIMNEPFKNKNRGEDWHVECESVLKQARSLLDPTLPLGKELLDHVGGDLLKVLVLYMGVSKECRDISTLLIQGLAAAFDPAREMFTAFFEVINIYNKPQTLHLCLPLLHGVSIVFPRISRRKAEFFKEATQGLLKAGRSAGQIDLNGPSPDDMDDGYRPLLPNDFLEGKVIEELVYFAKLVRGICDSQSIACGVMGDNTTQDLALELMQLLSFSNLSLSSLISTSEVNKMLNLVLDEDEDELQVFQLEAQRGAALAVYWGTQRKEIGYTTSEVVHILKQNSETPEGQKRIVDVICLASTLLVHVPCKHEISLMQKGVSLMACILEIYESSNSNKASHPDDGLELAIQIRAALQLTSYQRLQNVVLLTQNVTLRRQAYTILIKIIAQVLPPSARFATLYYLISNCVHPSLVSLLLTCVKDEVSKAWPISYGQQKVGADLCVQSSGSTHNVESSSSLSPFTSPELLQMIQGVLRSNEGAVAELPTNLDAVLGALNLYRFLLIRESTGNTNYTNILSEEELMKGRKFWLLPLREQVLRIQAVLETDETDMNDAILLGLDCLQSVIYRCLEIVEELLAKLHN